VLNEEQTIGAVVRLARSSPVMDRVSEDDTAARDRVSGADAVRRRLRGEDTST